MNSIKDTVETKSGKAVIFFASVDTRGRVDTSSATVQQFSLMQPGSEGSFALAWAYYERDKLICAYTDHPSRLKAALHIQREKVAALSTAKMIELELSIEKLWEMEDFWIRR
jgi:hypothetical protein